MSSLRRTLAPAGWVLFLGLGSQPLGAAEATAAAPCVEAQPDVAALLAGTPASAVETSASCPLSDGLADSVVRAAAAAKPIRPGYCKCGCGTRCTSDADCGPGGTCVAFISCC